MLEDVVCKVPMTYGGQVLERGEIFRMRGFPRDPQLFRIGYVVELTEGMKRDKQSCDKCGKVFVGFNAIEVHRRKSDCLAESAPITAAETAEMLGTDIDKVRVE
jgi:hypothetical protein